MSQAVRCSAFFLLAFQWRSMHMFRYRFLLLRLCFSWGKTQPLQSHRRPGMAPLRRLKTVYDFTKKKKKKDPAIY